MKSAASRTYSSTTSFWGDPQFATWLTCGLVISLLLHLFLFILAQTRIDYSPKGPAVIEVSLVPSNLFPQQPEKRQIVTEPQSKAVETAPENARFEAERNRFAEREQIKRGDGPDAGSVVGKPNPATPPLPPSPQAKPQQQQQPQQQTPKQSTAAKSTTTQSPQTKNRQIRSLRLSPDDLQGEFGISAPKKDFGPKAQEFLKNPSSSLGGYQPFSRPAGSGARFLGNSGSSDFIPQLPDGDITLLNAKASKFAVFVRRVATRVFSELRASGWETLSSSDISRMKDFSTIHAVLSPEGKLLSVRVEGQSGSSTFDQVLNRAVQGGASDPHPPEGALAADGNIHFIFKARSWSQ
ncbi:MAG: energy transducer TonB, partial [Bdellovibrionales bacterium]|nr:energy transducer TonB [Bdellovibrionales bacterium]